MGVRHVRTRCKGRRRRLFASFIRAGVHDRLRALRRLLPGQVRAALRFEESCFKSCVRGQAQTKVRVRGARALCAYLTGPGSTGGAGLLLRLDLDGVELLTRVDT